VLVVDLLPHQHPEDDHEHEHEQEIRASLIVIVVVLVVDLLPHQQTQDDDDHDHDHEIRASHPAVESQEAILHVLVGFLRVQPRICFGWVLLRLDDYPATVSG
jgi:hypothetical protein